MEHFAQNWNIFLFFHFVIGAATPLSWVGDPLFFWVFGWNWGGDPSFLVQQPLDFQKFGFPGRNVPWPGWLRPWDKARLLGVATPKLGGRNTNTRGLQHQN